MARRLRVIRNPEGLEYGQWIPIHAVKFNDDGSVSMMAEHRAANRGRRRRRNIAAGYWAGEPPLKRRKKAKAKRRRR